MRGRFGWLAALAVCVLLAGAGGGSAQDGDGDGGGGDADHVLDWREFVVYNDQEWSDERLGDPEPPTGLLWWECLTATCVWPAGYGEIVAVTDEYRAAAEEFKEIRAVQSIRVIDLLAAQEDMTEVIDAQPRLNIDGDHTAAQGEVIACVSKPDEDNPNDPRGYCYTRFPPRLEADTGTNQEVLDAERESLWGYAGDERFIKMTEQVRHHNIWKCERNLCYWGEAEYEPLGPGNELDWLPFAWVIDDGRPGFDYDDDGRIDSHGENTHPAIAVMGMDGVNEDRAFDDIPQDRVIASFCEMELDGSAAPHCKTTQPGSNRRLAYQHDWHPAHRLDRPLLETPMCFERSDFDYPTIWNDYSKEYRRAGFDGWPVWVPWITQRVVDNGYYSADGFLLDPDDRTRRDPSGALCGGGGGGGGGDDFRIADVKACDFLHPDPPWRVQAYEPTGPPSYAYERDGGLLADGSPVLEGNWVRLSEDLDVHPLGQALKSPDGDMDSLIVEDDTLRYAIAPDLSRLHSYPPFAYDREGNRARYMAPTPPAYRLDTAQNLWLPVCWYRH